MKKLLIAAILLTSATPAPARWWNTKMWNHADNLFCVRLPSQNVWVAYWGC